MPTVAERIKIAEQEQQKELEALTKRRQGMSLQSQVKRPGTILRSQTIPTRPGSTLRSQTIPTRPGSTLRSQTIKQEPHLLSMEERAKRRALAAREKRRKEGSFLPESLYRLFEPSGMSSDETPLLTTPQSLTVPENQQRQLNPTERQGGPNGYTYVGSAEQQGALPLIKKPTSTGAPPQQLRTDDKGTITEQDVGQYLAQNPLDSPVSLSDADFEQAGLYDQNAYLQQARQGEREIRDPMQIETGYDPSNLPGGIFGAQLGYLKAAQSLIGPAAMGKARKRQGAIALQQQKASAAQRKEARNYDLNLNRHLLDRFKAQQPVLKMQKEYDEYGNIVGEAPVWHKRPTNQELDNQANQQQARQQLIKRAHARATAAIKKGIDPAAIDAELERMGFPPLGGGEGGGGGGGGQQLRTTAPPLSIRQQRGGMPINSELSQANRPSPEQVDEMVQGLLYQSPALERQQGAMVRSQTPLIPKEMLKLLKARKLSDIAREERELLNIKPRGTR